LLLLLRRQERHGLEFWLRWQDREGEVVVDIYSAMHRVAAATTAEQVLADEIEGETVGVSGEGHVRF